MKISKRRVEYSHLGGNLRLVSMTDEERKELAQQHNTEKWAISPNLYFVEFSSFNRNYRGYGIRNVNGGIEFINPLYMKNPITLDNKGYVYVAHSKDDSNKHCCLFWEFTDYLAYLSIQKKHFLNLPKDCDCFIMSDVRNFIPMVVDTDDYENIYMFFPNNEAVIIFIGLTAWDSQKIKKILIEESQYGVDEHSQKIALLGALELYLDFVNLFIYILRILGSKK